VRQLAGDTQASWEHDPPSMAMPRSDVSTQTTSSTSLLGRYICTGPSSAIRKLTVEVYRPSVPVRTIDLGGNAMAKDYSLVIRNGTVIDGTGAAPREADVAVRDGHIAAVGKVTGAGAEEIDAKGRIVTPGLLSFTPTTTARQRGTRTLHRRPGTASPRP